MKRYLTTILLVIAATALALYVWRDRDKLTTGEKKGREFSVFPAWRRDDLTKIEISHEGETIVLERENKDALWRMKSPREERVDQGAAERMMTTLEFATRVRPVVANDALGFEHPRAAGTVSMGGMKFQFVLGGVSPRPDNSGYLKVDDGAPFVCSKEMADTLLAGADTYRDRSVVPYLSLELSKFIVTHPGGGFALERIDERSFKVLANGRTFVASRKDLDRAWGALAEMRAESFPKDADVDRLTANPKLTIRMEPKEANKGAAVLVIGDACPGHADDVVVLRKEPTRVAACAPKGALDRLLEITPASLVDGRAFGFRHDEIEEMRLEGGDVAATAPGQKTIEFARRGTGFHLREPEDRELLADEAEAVSEMLTLMEKSAGTPILDKPTFKSVGKTKVRVAEFEETIELGAIEDGKMLVHRLRDDAYLSFDARAGRRFIARQTTLRPRALLLKETRAVTRVALRCGEEQDFVDAGEGLQLVKPAGYVTDGSITQLVDAILRGKATEWTADRDDGSFGFEENGCRVILSFADGNSPVTVRLGKGSKAERFAQLDGDPKVFVTDAALPVLMQKVFVSRGALVGDPEDADEIILKVGGRVVPGDLAKRAKVLAHFDARVVKLGTADVGRIDVEIEVRTHETGKPTRIVCAAPEANATTRRCANPDVKAVWQESSALVGGLVGSPVGPGSPAISDAGTSDAR